MTLPVLRAVGTTNSYYAANSALAKPAGTVSGDVMLAFLLADGVNSPASWATRLPAGWTVVQEDLDTNAFRFHGCIAYKVAGGSEPSTYGFTFGTQSGCGVIISYSGVDNTTPIHASAKQLNSSSSTTCACPSVTTTVGDCLGLVMYLVRASNGVNYTQPSGWTERVDYKGPTVNSNFGVAELNLPSAGATGTVNATSAVADESWTATIALNPAVPGGGDTTAPTLTSPTGTSTGSTIATVGATTDEGNGTLYAVVTTSATAPTKAQVKAGQNAAGSAANWSGSVAVSSAGAKTLNATGLTDSTTYYAHLMHEDAATNQANVVSSTSFTTSAGASGSRGRYFYQFGSPQC